MPLTSTNDPLTNAQKYNYNEERPVTRGNHSHAYESYHGTRRGRSLRNAPLLSRGRGPLKQSSKGNSSQIKFPNSLPLVGQSDLKNAPVFKVKVLESK